MNVDVGIALDHHYADDLPELVVDWQAAAAPAPRTLVVNDDLAAELGIDPGFLRSDAGAAFLVGNDLPHGARPVAQAYAGHQFGSYSPRLGDGRALLLGELRVGGTRRDLHLKGSGRTPFARGGDGKAATGPMLREYVISEAMHALGIPTTRALAVVATGEPVRRDTMLPGAVLVRVAASHLRVGTFQYAAALDDGSVLRRLADHAIARHAPHATDAPTPAVALYDSVVEAQAALIAQWMQVGFIHGVMNTDNVTISGETIDYGPCAFMDRFDPATVFSSIDHHGRYAYGNQPPIAQWNLARLAEAMLPLFASTTDAAVEVATEVLNTFPGRFDRYWASGMRAKLGLGQVAATDADTALIDDWFTLVHASGADLTSTMRALGDATREAASGAAPTAARAELRSRFTEPEAFDAWHTRLLTRLRDGGTDLVAAAAAMDAHNPVYVPRNHLVEEALAAATAGDLAPVERLVEVVTQPFTRRADATRYEQPAPPSDVRYQTFCGT